MIERIVNIFWQLDKDELFGHVSIFRPLDDQHEIELMRPNQFSICIVALASPLACLLMNDFEKARYCEELRVVPAWVE
ncbi:hypothetical protein [aff. Roholtiella sp. LEGE 12411]|uniref:hypothetical protein n=1 Tax=aff. Roholtiella sp. LEGE 12411 TaxID=1828822 RepID=UPI001881F5EA|nr:hypothetical protein [aff. Roholtiella sp. LEGE 12411]MBE9037008.1 hypothetical protein [aff. Roholtiella sp. LEGE 12411]